MGSSPLLQNPIGEMAHVEGDRSDLLRMAITKLGPSVRAYDRILKVGRTIADLAPPAAIRPEHIGGAIQYRSLGRNLWRTS